MNWYFWLLVSTLGIKVKTIFEMYHDDVIFMLLKFKDIAMKTWRKWFKHSVEHWKTLCKKIGFYKVDYMARKRYFFLCNPDFVQSDIS